MNNKNSPNKGKKVKEDNNVKNKDKSGNVPLYQRPIYVEPTYGTEEINYDDVYDEGDIASALEMSFIAKALADHKNKVAPEKHPDFDGMHCIDCDSEIPRQRLDMGRIRCVDCQSELELRNKLKGIK